MPWQRSRRVGGTSARSVPRHLRDHEQHVEDFLTAESDAKQKSKKRRAKVRQHVVRFQKLDDGRWGIIGPRHVLVPGRLVAVTRKDGKRSPAEVGEIIKSDGEWVIARVK